jgi:hypothetical protein
VIYVISWLLPVHANGVKFPRGMPGWQAFVVALLAPWDSQALDRDLWWRFVVALGFLSALTNVLMLLSAPILLIGARRGTRILACLAAAAWLVNAVWIIVPGRDQLRVGYYLWWTSFAILAAAASHHREGRRGDIQSDTCQRNKPMHESGESHAT